MAHYACDCWDAELSTRYGWIECVGCADRSAYDLGVHMRRTGEKLVVQELLPEPRKVTEWQAVLDKRISGRTFRRDAKPIESTIKSLDQQSLEAHSKALNGAGETSLAVSGVSDAQASVQLKNDVLHIERVTRIENVREYTPNVIEPSFGIGRILYSLLEHVYWHRPDDVMRGVLSIPLSVAPTKVLIVPLSSNASLNLIVKRISQRLRALRISSRVDSSGASIGKRYSRNDELGTPLGITVDFDTLQDGSVTLRERDSTLQVRGSEDDIVAAVQQLLEGVESWEEVQSRLPEFPQAEMLYKRSPAVERIITGMVGE